MSVSVFVKPTYVHAHPSQFIPALNVKKYVTFNRSSHKTDRNGTLIFKLKEYGSLHFAVTGHHCTSQSFSFLSTVRCGITVSDESLRGNGFSKTRKYWKTCLPNQCMNKFEVYRHSRKYEVEHCGMDETQAEMEQNGLRSYKSSFFLSPKDYSCSNSLDVLYTRPLEDHISKKIITTPLQCPLLLTFLSMNYNSKVQRYYLRNLQPLYLVLGIYIMLARKQGRQFYL